MKEQNFSLLQKPLTYSKIIYSLGFSQLLLLFPIVLTGRVGKTNYEFFFLIKIFKAVATSLKEERLSFLAMNFFRCRTVAWAEHRIHFRFRPRSLLLLHSRQMLTWRGKVGRSGGIYCLFFGVLAFWKLEVCFASVWQKGFRTSHSLKTCLVPNEKHALTYQLPP